MSLPPREGLPTGPRRKKLVQESLQSAESFAETGAEQIRRGHYTWINSPLEKHDLMQTSFTDTFRGVLPFGERSIRTYVEKLLTKRKGGAVGVEFGGIGSRLFSDFTPGFFAQSIGVTLVDHRSDSEKRHVGRSDGTPYHQIMVGNVLEQETYDRLDAALGGRKADFIIERMGKGLEFIPPEPYTLMRTVSAWYERLNEGGCMFVQVPWQLGPLLREWTSHVRRTSPTLRVTCYVDSNKDSAPGKRTSFFLQKLPGAPATLPTLDPRTVQRIGILAMKDVTREE